jgi:hypothetical protein
VEEELCAGWQSSWLAVEATPHTRTYSETLGDTLEPPRVMCMRQALEAPHVSEHPLACICSRLPPRASPDVAYVLHVLSRSYVVMCACCARAAAYPASCLCCDVHVLVKHLLRTDGVVACLMSRLSHVTSVSLLLGTLPESFEQKSGGLILKGEGLIASISRVEASM